MVYIIWGGERERGYLQMGLEVGWLVRSVEASRSRCRPSGIGIGIRTGRRGGGWIEWVGLGRGEEGE